MPVTNPPARLTPAATQKAFRTLLSALASPGRVFKLADPPPAPAAMVLPLVLSDFTSVVAVLGDRDGEIERRLAGATGAVIGPAQAADQVVVADPESASPDLIETLKPGTALAPEEGARLALAVSSLGSGPVFLQLSGPGVKGKIDLFLSGPASAVFEALGRANANFPAGIDTWLFAPDGSVAAIPRSSKITVTEVC
jgi:alpha-D-ribose 1-methylphosphonate 5-triphosphate synthase subunit PhnH